MKREWDGERTLLAIKMKRAPEEDGAAIKRNKTTRTPVVCVDPLLFDAGWCVVV